MSNFLHFGQAIYRGMTLQCRGQSCRTETSQNSVHREVFKGSFAMERRVVHIQSRPAAIMSKYTPLLDLLAVLQIDSEAETTTDDLQENKEKTPVFRVAKYVVIPPSTEASVSITTSCAGLINTVPHPSLMRNRIILLVSEVLNVQPPVLTKICVWNVS